MEADFAKGSGLVPVVVQESGSGRVLMLAYMDREAFDRTLSTGEMHYRSRSREKLWRKGEESGNVQRLHTLTLDCDGDALLAEVHQTGNACHTGKESCFHNAVRGEHAGPFLAELWSTILARLKEKPAGSYTASLLQDETKRLKKIAEEAGEVILAAKSGKREEAIHEFADLLYHALVAMAAMGITPEDVQAELRKRRR